MKRVLILCTGNSCRSQMAEGIINQALAGEWSAVSAGTEPAGYVHPQALEAMAEIGIATDGMVSKHVGQFVDQPFDAVVTVCDSAAESCPMWFGMGKVYHQPYFDPAKAQGTPEEVMAVFRQVRDQIREELPALLQRHSATA